MSTKIEVDLPSDDDGGDHSLHLRGFDREINLPAVVWSGVVLTVVTVLCFLVCWWGLHFMEQLDEKHEARLTAIQEAMPQGPAPLPALQEAPQDDLKAMRAVEEVDLKQPAWIDQQNGKARIPIEVAIDTIFKRGVSPLEAPAPMPAPAAAGAPEATGAGATSDSAAPPANPGGHP